MFKNKKKKIDPNMTDTLIGEGTTFEGKISSQAGIRVEGQMIGNIECEGDIGRLARMALPVPILDPATWSLQGRSSEM